MFHFRIRRRLGRGDDKTFGFEDPANRSPYAAETIMDDWRLPLPPPDSTSNATLTSAEGIPPIDLMRTLYEESGLTLPLESRLGSERRVEIAAHVPGYELLEELGRGSMGVVYKARHLQLNRLVALKMILSGDHAGSLDRVRFCCEAEAAARLQHPNIVQIYEVSEHEGRPYIVLEYVEGIGLDSSEVPSPMPERAAARLLETLAWAMSAAHERGIVHRDLKPANVLLTADGTPKISDFGLAKLLDRETGHTQSGSILGTPSYMAPEQAAGKTREIGPAADLYSLGAILYELLTGRPPFRAATPMATLQQVLNHTPVPPRQLVPELSRDLETICLKCLEKEPRKRYADAAALAADLRRFQLGLPVLARPVGDLERIWRLCRRNPLPAALLAGLIAELTVGLAFATCQWREAVSARDALTRAIRIQEIIESLESAISELKDAETGQRGYLLTGDEQYLEPYRSALSRLEPKIGRLRELTKDDEQMRGRLDLLESLSAAKLHELESTIKLYKRSGIDSALRVVRTNRGNGYMKRARKLVWELEQAERRKLASLSGRSLSRSSSP